MSSTLLTFKFKQGGVLTDATSVSLSDSTGTYGVRRTDTLASVVAANTAMTHAGTGLYTYTFTDPAAGLEYQWVAKVVYGGVTSYFGFTAAGGPGDAISGDWFNTQDSARKFAGRQLDMFADKEESGGSDLSGINSAWQQSLDRASASIRLAWRRRLSNAGVSYVAFSSLTLDPDEAAWLAETADWGTLVNLYSGYGARDEFTADFDGKMTSLRKRYEARLAEIQDGTALTVAQSAAGIVDPDSEDPGTFSFVPIVRDDVFSGDEFSQ